MILPAADCRSPELRKRLPYIGKPRGRRIIKTWEPDASGLLRRIERSAPTGGRAFAAPVTAITWSRTLQTEAIDRGVFIERADDNHARVMPLDKGTDADIMQQLVAQARAGDAYATTALQFIAQQDQYGWSSAWENATIARWTPNLMWYHKDKEKERAAKARVSAKYAAMANKRHNKRDQTNDNWIA
jgi:hypothetical protein